MKYGTKNKILKTFNNKFWLTLKDYKLKPEVSLIFRDINKINVVRMDLMAVGINDIKIIDYKTDVIQSAEKKKIPEKYLDQLRSYKCCIQNLYPDYIIHTFIVWIHLGDIVEVEI